MALSCPTGTTVIIVEWVLLLTAAVLISARLYLRLKINRQRLTTSDVFVLLAWCTSAAYSSCDSINLSQGVLNPDVDMALSGFSPEIVQAAMKTYFAGTLIIMASFYLCKAAILSFYFQLVPPSLTTYRIVLWALVAFTIIGYIVSILIYLIWTLPVHCNWSFNDTCNVLISTMDIFRIGWAIQFAGDIFIFIFPLCIYRGIQMDRLVKIGMYFIFALGVVNIAFCLSRFLMIELAYVKGAKSSSLTLQALWVDVDLNVGLIIACLPSLRPYLRMIQSGSRSQNPELELNKHEVRKSRQSVKDRVSRSKDGLEATNKSLPQVDLEAQEEWYHDYRSRTETSNGANSGRSLGSDIELVDVGRQTN